MKAPVIAICCLVEYCKNSSSQKSEWPINMQPLNSQPITTWLAKQTKNYWLLAGLSVFPPFPQFLFLPPSFLFGQTHLQTPDIHLCLCRCTVLLNCYHLFHKPFWQLTSWPSTSKKTTVTFNLSEPSKDSFVISFPFWTLSSWTKNLRQIRLCFILPPFLVVFLTL